MIIHRESRANVIARVTRRAFGASLLLASIPGACWGENPTIDGLPHTLQKIMKVDAQMAYAFDFDAVQFPVFPKSPPFTTLASDPSKRAGKEELYYIHEAQAATYGVIPFQWDVCAGMLYTLPPGPPAPAHSSIDDRARFITCPPSSKSSGQKAGCHQI